MRAFGREIPAHGEVWVLRDLDGNQYEYYSWLLSIGATKVIIKETPRRCDERPSYFRGLVYQEVTFITPDTRHVTLMYFTFERYYELSKEA
jgi:hypothetical protein